MTRDTTTTVMRPVEATITTVVGTLEPGTTAGTLVADTTAGTLVADTTAGTLVEGTLVEGTLVRHPAQYPGGGDDALLGSVPERPLGRRRACFTGQHSGPRVCG